MKLTLRVSCEDQQDIHDFIDFERLLRDRLDFVVASLNIMGLLPTEEEVKSDPEWFVTLAPITGRKHRSIHWRYHRSGWCEFGVVYFDQNGATNTSNVVTVLQSADRTKQWVVSAFEHEGLFDAVMHRPAIENLIRPHHPSDHMALSLSGEDGAHLEEAIGPAHFTSLQIKKIGRISGKII